MHARISDFEVKSVVRIWNQPIGEKIRETMRESKVRDHYLFEAEKTLHCSGGNQGAMQQLETLTVICRTINELVYAMRIHNVSGNLPDGGTV